MKIKKLATTVVGALRGHVLPEGAAKAVEALEKELTKAGVELDEEAGNEDPVDEETETEGDEDTGDDADTGDEETLGVKKKATKAKKAKKAKTA